MDSRDVLRAWRVILSGRRPFLSIEITRECPLRCPGCYAYGDDHLQGLTVLRDLHDHRGAELVREVLALVDHHKPLHLSIVGGDPLVRYRELDELLPRITERGIHVQVVTSAFRKINPAWQQIRRLTVVVSVDGLQPEHDARRKPATYERILSNISESRVTIHCTITAQMMTRSGYLEEFVRFWSNRPEVKKIWMSIFTPQKGELLPEILSSEQRAMAVAELNRIRAIYPKLDMSADLLEHYIQPPKDPQECIFARTTTTISADLKTRITPCQFGGNPDCSQCGCFASAGLAAIGNYKALPGLPARKLFDASEKLAKVIRAWREESRAPDSVGRWRAPAHDSE